MAKRVLLVAMIVAAILVVAAPALAFNGYRSDYTTAAECTGCHPDKHAEWMTTAHSSIEPTPSRSPTDPAARAVTRATTTLRRRYRSIPPIQRACTPRT